MKGRRAAVLFVAVSLAATLVPAPAGAAAVVLGPCEDVPGARCGTITRLLDPTDPFPAGFLL